MLVLHWGNFFPKKELTFSTLGANLSFRGSGEKTMRSEPRRDPRPGLPSVEERRKTTQPLNRKSDRPSERDTSKRARDDFKNRDRWAKG
jgi:hypothetical protein